LPAFSGFFERDLHYFREIFEDAIRGKWPHDRQKALQIQEISKGGIHIAWPFLDSHFD
jgi:hypothetical protein